ncbi:MAG TPA: NAD(P)H-binding protein [Chloroflexia bacterium]|nr:NAD(P)H-binding protein [Chloroflexia bacterium]
MLLLVGGTGFVGSYLLEALDQQGRRDQVRILVRSAAKRQALEAQGWATAAGDLIQPATLAPALAGVDTVINLVSIIREKNGQTFAGVMGSGPRHLVDAARAAGVTKFVYMSALGTSATSVTLSQYYKYKWASEEYLRQSGIPFIIFRPSFLIGPGGEFTALLNTLTLLPLVNVPGPGTYPVQPMYVRDLARYVVQMLDDPRALNQTLEIGGPETFTYNTMIRKTLAAKGKKGILIHMPLPLMRLVVPVLDKLLPALITQDQFNMLLKGSATKDTRLADWGGFPRTPFVEAMRIGVEGLPPPTARK